MPLSREVANRAIRRIGLSSAGEATGRAVNLLLPFALLSIHSVSELTDKFFLAMAIAFFVQGTLSNSLVNALVPEIINNKRIRNLRVFLYWAVFIGLLAGLATYILASNQLSPVASLVTVTSVAIMAIAGFAASPAIATLNAAHHYGMPGLSWGLRIIPVAFYLVWQPDEPALHWLLAGIALTDTVRTIILARLTRKQFRLRDCAEALHFPLSAKHLILASAISGFSPLIIRWISSLGNAGDVSIFEAADRLYGAVASLATIGVGNVTLVYLANLANSQDSERSWKLILRTSMAWSVLWLILSILLWLIFPSITAWIEIQASDVLNNIRQTFLTLALGIPGFIMSGILGRRLLTLGFSRTLIPLSVTGLIFIGITGSILFNILGTAGLGLSLSASQYLIVIMMSNKLSRIKKHANTHSI